MAPPPLPALPPAPGDGRGDWEKPGEFGELLKLFGEAGEFLKVFGEASGEHGGDPIASWWPGLPEIDKKY